MAKNKGLGKGLRALISENVDLDENGMVIDFIKIKELVQNKLNHKYLNEVLNCNPTAENIAKWIVDTVPFCYKAVLEEAQGSIKKKKKDVQD